MEYILEYKEFTRKTILYLHGLKGHLNDEYEKILNDLNCNYVGISIDYKESNIWEILEDIKVDGVIGHSLGGYIAFYLSNYKKIPALLLMPSFDEEDIDLQKLPKDVKESKFYENKIALIGKEDDVVIERDKQMEILNGIEIYKEDIGHDMNNKLFQKYAEIFIDSFFKL